MNGARGRIPTASTAIAILLALGACLSDVDEAATPAAADTSAEAATPSAPGVLPQHMIRADGIGSVRAGMTIGALRAALTPDAVLGEPAPYMVDIDGMAVVSGADTLYHILVPAGESTADDAPITLVATTSLLARTADGIGPGVTLADAAAIHGEPTLAYNVDDESREYAVFAGVPASIRLRVAPASASASLAGIYTTQGAYNETSRYDPAARIMMVIVFVR